GCRSLTASGKGFRTVIAIQIESARSATPTRPPAPQRTTFGTPGFFLAPVRVSASSAKKRLPSGGLALPLTSVGSKSHVGASEAGDSSETSVPVPPDRVEGRSGSGSGAAAAAARSARADRGLSPSSAKTDSAETAGGGEGR